MKTQISPVRTLKSRRKIYLSAAGRTRGRSQKFLRTGQSLSPYGVVWGNLRKIGPSIKNLSSDFVDYRVDTPPEPSTRLRRPLVGTKRIMHDAYALLNSFLFSVSNRIPGRLRTTILVHNRLRSFFHSSEQESGQATTTSFAWNCVLRTHDFHLYARKLPHTIGAGSLASKFASSV